MSDCKCTDDMMCGLCLVYEIRQAKPEANPWVAKRERSFDATPPRPAEFGQPIDSETWLTNRRANFGRQCATCDGTFSVTDKFGMRSPCMCMKVWGARVR